MAKEFVIELHRKFICDHYISGKLTIPELGFECDTLEYSFLENDKFHRPLEAGRYELNTKYIDRNPYAAHVKGKRNSEALFQKPERNEALKSESIMVGKLESLFSMGHRSETANDAFIALNVSVRNVALSGGREMYLDILDDDSRVMKNIDTECDEEDEKPKSFGMTDEELERMFDEYVKDD